MKKLKLKMQELSSPEVLSRQQLKNVLGGAGVVTTTGCRAGTAKCTCDGATYGCRDLATCVRLCLE